MPALHIRDVPPATVASLRERARREGVSMQAVLRRILNEAAAESSRRDVVEPLRLHTAHTTQSERSTSTWSREEIYDASAR
ncbi:FitA-like ribbon-helix-helix domain-containing protein [Piscicoccus intestinalis]|uniref:FitA-like ribbon-helix-helix domain-containing protein n=1 Tax=Piscicoccus intestinalis TaxID=746033 RepID=UPI0035710804